MTKLNQRDTRWRNIKLGFSTTTTIGSHGCTITCVGMLAGINPDDVNERLKKVNGYANTNLIIWSKIKEAIPWLEFEWRAYAYDNAKVAGAINKNGGCLVEVDGTPIGGSKHWVIYIGNQKLIDPWDGLEKPTTSYRATGYSIINKIGSKPEENNMSEYEEAIRKAVAYDEVCKLLKQPTTTPAEQTVDTLSKIMSDKDRYLKERNEARSQRDNYEKEVKSLGVQIDLLKKDNKALNDALDDFKKALEYYEAQIPEDQDLEKDYEATGRKIIKTIGDTTIETSYKRKV
jgi:molecular chaperone GrpE (heat shock protein)